MAHCEPAHINGMIDAVLYRMYEGYEQHTVAHAMAAQKHEK